MKRTVRIWLIWHDDPLKDPREYASVNEPDADRVAALKAQGYQVGFITAFLPSPIEAVELGSTGDPS